MAAGGNPWRGSSELLKDVGELHAGRELLREALRGMFHRFTFSMSFPGTSFTGFGLFWLFGWVGVFVCGFFGLLFCVLLWGSPRKDVPWQFHVSSFCTRQIALALQRSLCTRSKNNLPGHECAAGGTCSGRSPTVRLGHN